MKFLKYFVPFLAGLLSISTAYSQNTVYVIHGYGATVDNHWFKYIKHNLEDSKTSVTLISLPDSNNLNLEVRYSPMSRPNNHKIKIELG